MSAPAPTVIVKAWATLGDHATIPVAPTVTPGQASYNLGFPPATRTPKTSGGVPPFGVDMNGILFETTSNIVWLQAGMGYSWNSTFSTTNSGYAIGAVLRSAIDPWLYFYNRSAGNVNNPDVSTAGWTVYSPLANQHGTQTIVLASGTTNNQVIAAGTSLINLDTTAGAATLTGLVPEFDGQIIVVRVTGVNNLTLTAEDVLSSAANRWRVPTDLTLVNKQTQAFKNYASIPGWVAL